MATPLTRSPKAALPPLARAEAEEVLAAAEVAEVPVAAALGQAVALLLASEVEAFTCQGPLLAVSATLQGLAEVRPGLDVVVEVAAAAARTQPSLVEPPVAAEEVVAEVGVARAAARLDVVSSGRSGLQPF